MSELEILATSVFDEGDFGGAELSHI